MSLPCLLVLSRTQVSEMEHILPLWMTSWVANRAEVLHKRIRLGVRISSVDKDEVEQLSRVASSYYNKGKCILFEREGIISVVMHKDSTAADVLKAFMHDLVLEKLIAKDSRGHLESQSWMDKNYEAFLHKLQSSGWRT